LTKRRDFYDRYDLLLANWYSLTSRLQQEVQLIRRDLHDDLARWRPHQPEPDWSAYADRIAGFIPAGNRPLGPS
jgi:hypothetical protein